MQTVDPPQSPIRSWKAFGVQYFMIVVSILTALGFEQVVMSMRRANGAEAAQREIDEELRKNLKEVRECFQSNAKRLDDLQAWDTDAIREFATPTPNATNQQRLIASGRELWMHNSIWTPNLEHAAWDVAIANQSAGNIPTQLLRKYATAYTVQHDAEESTRSNFLTLDKSHLINVMADVDLGKATAQDALRISRQLIVVLKQTQTNLRHVERELVAALPGETLSTDTALPTSTAAAR
jgi:hypothetical protein